MKKIKYWGTVIPWWINHTWNFSINDIDISTCKIYGMYHIFCINDWKSLVESQISHLRSSGLLDVSSKLFVSAIISCDSDLWIIKNIIGDMARNDGILQLRQMGTSGISLERI